MLKLLHRYARSSTSTSSEKQPLSKLAEHQKYLAMCQCGDDIHDCLLFWRQNITELPKLFELEGAVSTSNIGTCPEAI